MEKNSLIWVVPHRLFSRAVESKDRAHLEACAFDMLKLCKQPRGIYANALAVAHSQVNNIDPLRFFVCFDGRVIVNPEMTRISKTTVDSVEGCMSFPDKPKALVQRSNKIDVIYELYKISKGALVPAGEISETLGGKEAKMFQHEIDHFDGKYIYDSEVQK